MILGIFSDRNSAERAITDLENLGFNPKDISIIMKDQEGARDMARETGSNVASGAASGAATGGVIGALAGLLIGIGALAIPGIGAVLIGGPIAAALGLSGAAATTASGAVTGILAGGLVGALTHLGVPEEEARTYEERIRSGAILLAVPVSSDQTQEVTNILQNNNADQVRTLNVNI